jgi:hypothetical protein
MTNIVGDGEPRFATFFFYKERVEIEHHEVHFVVG